MGMYREAIRKRFREVRKIMEKKMEGKQPKYLSGSKKEDMVNHPPHYNKNGIETILWRYRYKNGIEDLKKAQWYLNELIDELDDDKS